MSLRDLISPLRTLIHPLRPAHTRPPMHLQSTLPDVFRRTWDLGFTAFGGPPVHFQIIYRRFVNCAPKAPWIDEQTYRELFAICQALPGPASTKMVFCTALFHAGLPVAFIVFLIWSFPGALGMFALSLGVRSIHEALPAPVYALLSGLNAATVGIIALAAVQLARKAITDPLTRLLVAFGGCAGLCYNALWYFPVLMVVGGTITVAWDCWGKAAMRRWRKHLEKRREDPEVQRREGVDVTELVGVAQLSTGATLATLRRGAAATEQRVPDSKSPLSEVDYDDTQRAVRESIDNLAGAIPVKVGIAIIVSFFASFLTLMVLHSKILHPPLALQLFTNMYLAGTVIFGGGPVVIPLLREYVVQPGWVTPRDFLLGLAIIQAFPGPNFNFAVYLGSLAIAAHKSRAQDAALGAFLGFVGIFAPGLILALGFQSLWRPLRSKRWVTSLLRGINASAVGLVFTAVYRLWEIGFLTREDNMGVSLGRNPWWVVVAAATYTAVEWFSVPPAIAILSGGVLGLIWHGVVG